MPHSTVDLYYTRTCPGASKGAPTLADVIEGGVPSLSGNKGNSAKFEHSPFLPNGLSQTLWAAVPSLRRTGITFDRSVLSFGQFSMGLCFFETLALTSTLLQQIYLGSRRRKPCA